MNVFKGHFLETERSTRFQAMHAFRCEADTGGKGEGVGKGRPYVTFPIYLHLVLDLPMP